jgi:hypothetical protein
VVKSCIFGWYSIITLSKIYHISAKYYNAIRIGHKFPTNRFVEKFLQPTYNIDMCLSACENHMLF